MLTTLPIQSVSSSRRTSFEASPPARRDHGVAPASHTFATPVVREVPRPTAEPPWFEATW